MQFSEHSACVAFTSVCPLDHWTTELTTLQVPPSNRSSMQWERRWERLSRWESSCFSLLLRDLGQQPPMVPPLLLLLPLLLLFLLNVATFMAATTALVLLSRRALLHVFRLSG